MRGRAVRRDLPVRRPGMQVRRQPIRRSRPRLLGTQMYALAVMLLCAFSAVALVTTPALAARRLEVYGARFTGTAIVRQLVGLESTPNLFGLHTDRIAERLAGLPAVKLARVEVALPDTIVVTLVEREPRLVWVVGRTRYVADENGLLFGVVDEAGNPVPPASLDQLAGPGSEPGSETPAATVEPSAGSGENSAAEATATPKPAVVAGRSPTRAPTPTKAQSKAPAGSPSATETLGPETEGPSAPEASPVATSLPPPSLLPVPTLDPAASAGPGAVSLPVVYDRRLSDSSLALGDVVDPVALDAGYRLASLSPAEVGSTASSLDVALDDDHGFTMAAPSRGWVAEFGFYTPTLRKVSVIPGQVRDLRSVLLWAGEDKVAWIWLMSDISDSHIIDYLPR
jgi:hypothetical protein